MIGNQIQNYKIISLLGEGGMGDVYLAEHVSIKRKVAIKVLKPELVKNEEIRKRFKNEASMLAHLQHPNIVGLIDYVEQEDGLFLIMEYVDGQDLDELVKEQQAPITIERAKKLMTQILEAFKYAHQNGIIHRDVKPSNVLITADDQIKVLDFGIAKLVGESQHNLTKTGTQIGTVYYMSPEQVKGKELDQRSDIYSLGVTFYELLSGVCPYRVMTTEYEIYDNIVKVPLLPLTTTMGEAYGKVWSVIEKATEKETTDRFQNCEEFIRGLNEETTVIPKKVQEPIREKVEAVKPKPVVEESSSNWKIWTIIAVVLAFIIGGIMYFMSPDVEINSIAKIERGFVSEGEGYSIEYAYYASEEKNGDSLLPYQIKVNELIKLFVLDHSFVPEGSSLKDSTLNADFFSKVLLDSKIEANKASDEYESSINDSIQIDTNFVLFDQVIMSMFGYMAGGTGWQNVSYKIVEKETAKVLGLKDFVSNMKLFNNIAEDCFRKQMGIRNSDDFGDEYFFDRNVFFCPKDFYFANGNFNFSYAKYEIAAGAYGNVTFAVPISKVEHLLSRDLSTRVPVKKITPKDAEIKVEPMQTEEVTRILENYYSDLVNGNFDAYNYFASDVKQFIQKRNTTPDVINELNQTNDEYSEKNITISYETFSYDHMDSDDNQYWTYWIHFSCYRTSRSEYQRCNVRVEVGFDAEGKLISYREMEVTDLEYTEYNPAVEGY